MKESELEIPIKSTWAIFREGKRIICAEIYATDNHYLHFESIPDNVIYCIPKKEIIAKGTRKNLLKKYPEYLI
jgi:hypothetical protein